MFFFSDARLDREEIFSFFCWEYWCLPGRWSNSNLDTNKPKSYHSFIWYPFDKISIFNRKCNKIPWSFACGVSPEWEWKIDKIHIYVWDIFFQKIYIWSMTSSKNIHFSVILYLLFLTFPCISNSWEMSQVRLSPMSLSCNVFLSVFTFLWSSRKYWGPSIMKIPKITMVCFFSKIFAVSVIMSQ